MSKKAGNLFERYIDKAVLGIAVVLSLVILWFFVVSGPNAAEYNGTKYAPGEIDNYIKGQTKEIEDKLNDDPRPKAYTSKTDNYTNLAGCSVPEINDRGLALLPGRGASETDEDRMYNMPVIPAIADVAAEAIRTVVYVPMQAVNHINRYEMVEAEPGDIDIVSVQASIDISELYRNFTLSFNGPRIRKEWQDVSLAKPVFADVRLERQQRLENGSWSQWTEVPRSKVDNNRERIKLTEDSDSIAGNVSYLLLSYADPLLQGAILQPLSYDFASYNEEWLPPVLHKEAVELWKKEDMKAKRDERLNRPGAPGMGMPGMPGMGMPGTTPGGNVARGGRGSRERTIEDIRKDYEGMLIDEKTRLGQMRDPLVVWTHDDTVEPDNVYRYRLKAGVFNPIAGKDWFSRDEKHFKDQTVLWSEYSEVTEPVEIARMAHIFPLHSKEKDGTVTVKVSKFFRGAWRGHEFDIRPGQSIGSVIERELTGGARSSRDDKEDIVEINYATGAILVDLISTSDWIGQNSLRPRSYKEMLFTEDGVYIAHMPVDRRNWSKGIRSQFERIKGLESDEFEKLLPRGSGGIRRPGGGIPGMGMPGMGMPGMGM